MPGIDAFALVTSGQSFVPSAATEQLVTDQMRPASSRPTATRAARSSPTLQAEADGINAYFAGERHRPAAGDGERRDRGDRVHRLDLRCRRRRRGDATPSLLAKLQNGLGPATGRKAWDDAMLFDDPEAPTTITQPLRLRTAHRRPGHAARWSIDEDSIVSLDPRAAARARTSARTATRRRSSTPTVPAPPGPEAGVELPRRRPAAARRRGNTLAVMGPQLGYYYPEIVAADPPAAGPGIEAQGVGGARPRDVHPHRADAGLRVEPHVGQPRRARRVRRAALQPRRLGADARVDHYLFKGECRPFDDVRRGHARTARRSATRRRCTAR